MSRRRSCTTLRLGYEDDWLPQSGRTDPADLDAGWVGLEERAWAQPVATADGVALRQRIEDDTDAVGRRCRGACSGEADARAFAERFEPPCEALLRRVDVTAGPNYQPASRRRPDQRP